MDWRIPVHIGIDWQAVRDSLDPTEVLTRELDEPPGRRGSRSGRPWWHCPFHDDRNPSLTITREGKRFKCYGCGASGSAVDFVMKVRGMSFPEAMAYLSGGSVPSPAKKPPARPDPSPRRDDRPEARCGGLTPESAARLVEASAARLWTTEGERALNYLRGRGLTDETIRAARLGFTWSICLPGQPSGIVIPWREGEDLALIKIRQHDGKKPKYYEAFRNRERPPGLYPDPEVIRFGRPLVIPEGEFDALLLGQEIGDLASVVTLGSASARPNPAILGSMLAASPWYIATDADEAGDKAASGWPARARRARPPSLRPHPDDRVEKPKTDWTDLHRYGVNLRRWWTDRLGGNEVPPLFSWDELAGWRWGPAREDPTPGIVI